MTRKRYQSGCVVKKKSIKTSTFFHVITFFFFLCPVVPASLHKLSPVDMTESSQSCHGRICCHSCQICILIGRSSVLCMHYLYSMHDFALFVLDLWQERCKNSAHSSFQSMTLYARIQFSHSLCLYTYVWTASIQTCVHTGWPLEKGLPRVRREVASTEVQVTPGGQSLDNLDSEAVPSYVAMELSSEAPGIWGVASGLIGIDPSRSS